MTPIIEVDGLYKVFGNRPSAAIEDLKAGKTKAEILEKRKQSIGVAGVSFHVNAGEILVIMGLSGSGKSTLIRCLNRLVEPSAGTIKIDGTVINDLPQKELRQLRQQKTGMVFQHFALFPHRTVLKNAEYGLEIQGASPQQCKTKAMEALEQVGLKGWENAYPRQLSGGMQQRVGLARALALDPDILLMDEAFSALDPLIRKDMQDELLDLQQRVKKTIVFVSHDLDEALKLGDRILLMRDGKIIQNGTPEEILMTPADGYVERFVADADISKILTAESIMHKCRPLGHIRNDGPRAVLRKMKTADLSSLFVVSNDNHLMGLVTAEAAADALKSGDKPLSEILTTDIITTPLDTPAQQLFEVMKDIQYPLPVVTSDNKLAGIIVRGTLIAALAEGGGSHD